MTKHDEARPALASYDQEMEDILKTMLEENEDITARGVIRRHSNLRAASSITRNRARLDLLGRYKAKQEDFRRWNKRLAKRSKDSSALSLADKDERIEELERQVELLTVSHVAMLRAVGELGGFSKWAKFFEGFKEIRDELGKLGAMPVSDALPMEPHRRR